MKTAVKIDDNTIHVTWEDGSLHEYKFNFLLAQKTFITAQRDKELADVDELLALCEGVGLTITPKEEPVIEKIAEPVIEEIIITPKKTFFQWIVSIIQKIINWFR